MKLYASIVESGLSKLKNEVFVIAAIIVLGQEVL